MIPKSLKDYVISYPEIWTKRSLLGLDPKKIRSDESIKNVLYSKEKKELFTGRTHKGIHESLNEIFFDESCDRALFLAPVGTQCIICPEKVEIVIAGISTSKKAALYFYSRLGKENFPIAACNATFKGPMLKNLKEFVKMIDAKNCTDGTKKLIEDFNKWSPDKLRLDELYKISQSKDLIYNKILATQRIKDASLGFGKKEEKEGNAFYINNDKKKKICFSDSSAKSLCYGDLSLDNDFSKPFIDELKAIKNARGSKIPLLILLGKEASSGSKQLTFFDEYFNKIFCCNHPSRAGEPKWKYIKK